MYRLQRAPERYAFYVDTGDLPPAESLAFVNRVKQSLPAPVKGLSLQNLLWRGLSKPLPLI